MFVIVWTVSHSTNSRQDADASTVTELYLCGHFLLGSTRSHCDAFTVPDGQEELCEQLRVLIRKPARVTCHVSPPSVMCQMNINRKPTFG
jgi:hypothetical protein